MGFTVLKWDRESDGDATHTPTRLLAVASEEAERSYRHKLAQQLMKDSGRFVTGKDYILERLPDNYTLMERVRPSGPHHIDRFLYGHPKHVYFNSVNDFYPHLKWLSHGQEGKCECRVCKSPGRSTMDAEKALYVKELSMRGRPGRPSGRPAGRPPGRPPGRPAMPMSKGLVDQEGLPDTIPKFLSLLKKEGTLDRAFEERYSMDWRMESIVCKETFQRVSTQSAFIPRVGELILWHRNLSGEVRVDPTTKELKIWDGTKLTGHPTWLAGVVTQVPVDEEPVSYDDIAAQTEKKHGVNMSGFRIECYPDPNGKDKSFSHQYTYVPMHHIRPMAFIQDVTRGTPADTGHPTILHAMKATTSISCVDRYRLSGKWPDYDVHHRALYLGAENLWIGDSIRVLPQQAGKNRVTEVMIPKTFIVRTLGLKSSLDGTVTGTNASHIEIVLRGKVYTTDPTSSSKSIPASFPAASPMGPYGPWYHRSGPNSLHEIQCHHILGRLFEYPALKRWYRDIPPADALNIGLDGVLSARRHAIANRTTKGVDESGYFWGEHRADALGLATFNGIDVGIHDQSREPRKWRQVLAILDQEEQRSKPTTSVMSNRGSDTAGKSKGKEREVISVDSDESEEEAVDELLRLPDSKRARMQ